MIICDTIARTIAAPTEIPVGVITAVFGAPYFIYLLYRNSKNGKFWGGLDEWKYFIN